jgi:hypothetical protein
MNSFQSPLLILIAGPYRSNTGDDPEKIGANLRLMNEIGLMLFRKGHIPITGEALALPLIQIAGSERIGDNVFDQIFHPIARLLIDKVDAVLRVGGDSKGADEMIAMAQSKGKRVFYNIDEIDGVEQR